MAIVPALRARARRLRRAIWPLGIVVAGAVTCDSPTSLRQPALIAVQPVFAVGSISQFAGLTADQVRLTAIRPPSDTLAQRTYPFSPDSNQISASLAVSVTGTEQILVVIELLSGATVVFTGQQTVTVTGGQTTPPSATPVPMTFVGPGANLAQLQLAPRDSGVTLGGQVQFRVAATDSSNNPVAQYYASFATSATTNTINANGLFTAGTTRGTVWVRTWSPTGIRDSTRITVNPAPTQLQIVSGNSQSGTAGSALAQPLVVRVLAADNLPVAGARVQFQVSGGGTATPAQASTDSMGLAQTTVTLGLATGAQTVTATVTGVTPVQFGATANTPIGPPSQLTKNAGDGQSALVGTAVAVAPQVLVRDAANNPVPGVNVVFAVASGGGGMTGASQTTNASGLASVGSWTLGPAPGANTMTATVTGLTPVTFTATGTGPAITLSVVAATAPVGVGRTAVLEVRLAQPAPAGGVTVTVTSDSTQFLTVTAPGTIAYAAGDTLKTITITGVAAGTAVARGTAPGYSTGTVTIPVTANVIGLPASLNVAVGQSITPTLTLSTPAPAGGLVVTVSSSDSLKARVMTPIVNIAAGQTTANITIQGVATGAVNVGATASGYAPGSSSVTVTSTGSGIVSTTVSPRLDTLTSFGDTRSLTAQARDSANNPVAGVFSWVSRTPAVATVNASGVVTSVANGSSWIVVTEAGGTRDSANIVVQQRVASVNVSPAARNIYLTRNFVFTATAVDGRNNPVAGVGTFTWTTTAPAVATVDSTGRVTGIGLGTAQIRATTGAIIGVANVSIITPITRIAVVVDTVGAAVTDTFSMASLGLTRRYRARAHDTLDVVMSGLTFTWASSNGSVAIMNTTTGDTASVTSAANGITDIRATAQGFTSAPGARLTVAQVLASIELTAPPANPSAVIGITGTLALTARGKDANNRYISGGTFSYASSDTTIARVNASTGVVTGVANGTANITATSGAITSSALVVTVGGAVPSIISFGRDTVSVGRGGTASIPILLSRPAGSALTVNLSVADTFAFWSTASVTIPAGQTSINATLNGRNAGTTTVSATDGSGLGYSAGGAVAKVTANMALASGGYAINATDIVQTQVLLSDPSPAGGTYVTFSYSTPGIASISPDPAFIPAGQLAADIQIRGLAGGSTNITPSAIGVNGTASSFTAYAPVLTPSTTFQRLGQGQFEQYNYVYTPTYTNVPVVVSFTSSDTNVVTVTPTATIPGGNYYTYFTVSARGTGTATVSFSAPGWTSANTITVVGTTPAVGVCCGGQRFTTSPAENVTVYAQDSTRTAHYRTNSLVVRLSSSDTTVLRVLDSLVTIGPGQYYATSGRVQPAGLGGSAWLVATASGHRPDSTQFTVIGPPLTFSFSTARLGTGQEEQYHYVYTANNVTAPLTVTLANADSNVVGAPTTVTIPTGTYYSYFTTRGKAPGSSRFIASAPGYAPDTATIVVTTPGLTACCSTTLNNFGPGTNVQVYAVDSLRSGHNRTQPLTVTVMSTDTNVVRVDSASVTIAAGLYYSSGVGVRPVGTGTARIIFTAAGHTSFDTLTITVQTPRLYFAQKQIRLGRRQYFGPTDLYVYTPDYRSTPLTVTLARRNPAVDSLTATALTIPTGLYYQYYGLYGLALGADTIVATAPGYLPDTAFVTVTTPQFTNCCMPGSGTTTTPPFGMTVYATDSVGNAHYVMDTVVVAAVSSDTTVIRPVQAFFRLAKDAYYASPSVSITGPGTASITYSDSAATGYRPTTTGTITVTGPSLNIANGSPVLGMRQSGGTNSSYVYVPNNVTSPLTVNLVSTDTRVVTVPASVTIPTGSYFAYFDITAMDTVGTIQVQATATGYQAAATNVQVTQPRFVVSTGTSIYTTSARQGITVYAADANGSAHYTTENVTVTLLSSAPSVANVDSTTVTIPSGSYFNSNATWGPGIVGTAQLSASDQRSALYKYNTGTANISVVTPSLYLPYNNSTIGIGQYSDNTYYVYASDYQPSPLAVGFSRVGTPRTSTFANGTSTPVSGVTIAAGQYYEYFRLAGSSAGTDTMIVSATSPAHLPDTAFTVVGQGRIDPISGWPASVKVGDSVAVSIYARDPAQGIRNVLAATTFTLAPNANIEFRSGGPSSAVITSVTIPADGQFVTFYIRGLSVGTGSADITATNYSAYSNTVTVTP